MFSLKFIRILMLLIITGVISRCGKKEVTEPISTGLFTKHITVNGESRRYAIYIPKGIENQSVPLVFELHGGGVYIEDMTGASGHKTPYKLWMQVADTAKLIIIYPEGLNGAYGKPTWNDCRGDCTVNSHAGDVEFINTLIRKIGDKYPVNPKKIYVSGTSNGGFMAQRLGIALPNKIAAIASIVASKPAVSSCPNPSQPIPILFMLGTNDNHMPYNGGYLSNPPNPAHGSVISATETINYWVNFNQTSTQPAYKVFPDLDPNDGGIVEKFTYKNGTNNSEVVFYKINGGGHSAPSIREQYAPLFEQYFNQQNHDIEMVFEVWAFFKNKHLP